MKNSLILLCALTALPGVARAVDITFGASIASGFATNNGTALPTGSLVLIGTFNLTPTQITAAGNNLALLNLSWTLLGTGHIGDGDPAGLGSTSDPGNAGLLTGVSNNLNTTASGLNVAGSTLYYWVFNAPTAGAATQHGIFGSTDWVIPSGPGGGVNPNEPALNTDIDFLNPFTSPSPIPASILVGSQVGPDFRLATISAIPEPADTAAVAAAVALAFVVYRRRVAGKV